LSGITSAFIGSFQDENHKKKYKTYLITNQKIWVNTLSDDLIKAYETKRRELPIKKQDEAQFILLR